MAKVTQESDTRTSPRWAGDWNDRIHLLPGGAKVDAAAWAADGNGRKLLPSGTLLGRTNAERDAGSPYGPAADTDDEIALLAFDIDAAKNPECEIYRPLVGGVVKLAYLPAAPTSAVLAKLRVAYNVVKGA